MAIAAVDVVSISIMFSGCLPHRQQYGSWQQPRSQISTWFLVAESITDINMTPIRSSHHGHQQSIWLHPKSQISTWFLVVSEISDINMASSGKYQASLSRRPKLQNEPSFITDILPLFKVRLPKLCSLQHGKQYKQLQQLLLH